MSIIEWKWRRSLCHHWMRCWNKVKGIRITKRDLRIFIPAFLTLFASSYSLTMLFPFLPFLIQFLLPQVQEENIGKYAGFIASSLFLGRFFGSYVWGAVADRKGRKPVVITSLVLMGLSSGIFGFSVQIYMAVFFRFLVGLFNGATGTVKAIISESSTNTSQALSMSLITCAFSLGLVIGPAVSGALADPISQYNLTISDPVVKEFLSRFPFSLPCLLNTLLCLIAAVAVGYWMPETLRLQQHTNKSPRGGVSDTTTTNSSSSTPLSEDEQLLLKPSVPLGDRDQTDEPSSSAEIQIISLTSNISLTRPPSSSLPDKIDDTRVELNNALKQDEDVASSVAFIRKEEDVVINGVVKQQQQLADDDTVAEAQQQHVMIRNAAKQTPTDTVAGRGRDNGDNEGRRETESDAVPLRVSSRRSSLVAFFNRRPSFTPSFYKPARVTVKKKKKKEKKETGHHYTRVHTRRQRLVFQEEEEEEEEEEGLIEGKDRRDVTGGKRRTEEKSISIDTEREGEGGGGGERREVVELRTTIGRSVWKTLLNLKLFFTTRGTLLSLIMYCTFSFALIGFDEVFSLWAAASPHLGGLGWTLHEIGISQAVSGALFLPFSFTLFPVLERRFGLTATYQMNAIAVLVCMIILPIAYSISPDTLNVFRWIYIVLVVFVIRFSAGSVFAAIALFINNSVVFGKLGEVNGLAHSLTASLRTIAPVFSGTIFSLSVSSGARDIGFPVNYYLIFLLFGLIVFICTVLGAGLPASINRQKGTSDEEEEERGREEEEEEEEGGEREPSISSIQTEEDTPSIGDGSETSV